jgi:hypothetical protein
MSKRIHILGLFLLIACAIGSAQALDFTLNISGPHHVVQGHYMFFLVTAQVTAGVDEPATPTISGLPVGATAEFVDLAKFCCGTFLWRTASNNPVKISLPPATPTGVYPLTITYTSQSGVVRSALYMLIVDRVPSPLTPATYPADASLASLSQWQSNMTNFGRQHCGPLDMALGEGNLVYYDGTRVYYQIADYTNDPSWNACALMVRDVYRPYVLANNGAIPGYWVFTKGLTMDYQRTMDSLSSEAVNLLHSASYAALPDVAQVIGWQVSRESAFALEAHIDNESLGNPPSPNHADFVEVVLGHFSQWFLDKNAAYVQPFMVGLSSEALIAEWNLSHDARIPPAIQMAADQMWLNSWDASCQCFRYYSDDGTVSLSQDLNLLIAPLYGWVYRQTGLKRYRDMGDQIFNAGVAGAWLGAAGTGGKQFSQNYRWSGKYVEWRQTSAADTIPPTISITSPASAGTYSTSSSVINLAGTASDNVGVTQVTWTINYGHKGTAAGMATGTTAWTVAGIRLKKGSNSITFTAHDAAGNQASTTIVVVAKF